MRDRHSIVWHLSFWYPLHVVPLENSPRRSEFSSRRESYKDFQEYFRILASRKGLLLSCLAVLLGSGFLYTYSQVRIYEAGATVLIQPGEVRLLGDIRGIEDPVANALATQYQILSSRRIAEPVWRELDFDKKFSLGSFMQNIKVRSEKNSQIVRVSFRSPSPADAALAANALVGSYMRDNRQRAMGITDEGLKKLRVKEQELKSLVQSSAKSLAEYREKHPELPVDGSPTIAGTRLDTLNRSLVETEALRISKESEIAAQESSGPDAVDSERFHELRLEIQRLEEDRNTLLQRVRESHPLAKELERRLSAAQQRLNLALLSVLAAGRAELRSIEQRESRLRREVESLTSRIVESSQSLVQLRILQEEHSRAVEAHRDVAQRINELELSESTATRDLNVYWMERAEVPSEFVYPNVRMNLSLSAFMGLACGLALCFLFDYLDRSIKSKEEIQEFLGLSVVGYIPPVLTEGAAEEPALQGADPRSQLGEAFRTVRTGVSYGVLGGTRDRARKIVVTSTLPGDGKTLCSINLAIAFSHQGKRTLLVDADMRRPRIAETFSIRSNCGLSSFLAGEAPLPSLAAELRGVPDFPGLSLLVSGPCPPNPADLLNGERMNELLDQLEGQFDWIVLDAPPATLSDPVILSAHVKNVLFVVRAYVTPRDLAAHAVAQFAAVGAKVIGVVMNNANLPRFAVPAGYGYSYGYQHSVPDRSSEPAVVGNGRTPAGTEL